MPGHSSIEVFGPPPQLRNGQTDDAFNLFAVKAADGLGVDDAVFVAGRLRRLHPIGQGRPVRHGAAVAPPGRTPAGRAWHGADQRSPR
jgi:hypothetical protein